MRYKNLPQSDLSILSKKQADGGEKWATSGRESGKLHPTIDTYYEAFTKGAKAALSLPHMPFGTAEMAIGEISIKCGTDHDWSERAWKAFWYGDVPDLETAIASTKKIDPEPEPADPDKI